MNLKSLRSPYLQFTDRACEVFMERAIGMTPTAGTLAGFSSFSCICQDTFFERYFSQSQAFFLPRLGLQRSINSC